MSRFFFIIIINIFTIAGVKKIVCYTKDFIIYRFVILRFHCIVFTIRKQ